MRPIFPLICVLPSLLLSARAPRLDHGRLDPAWFGPELAFERAKTQR